MFIPLSFHSRLAYRSGVTTGITPPTGHGFFKGLSVAFHTGARDVLQKGAVIQDVAALHVGIGKNGPASVSTQIGVLRHLLLSEKRDSVFSDVASVRISNCLFITLGTHESALQGEITLVVHVESADIMATLLRLKEEVEGKTTKTLRLSKFGVYTPIEVNFNSSKPLLVQQNLGVSPLK